MRILFTRFPLESAYGGAEIQTLNLMDGLRAAGHEMSFLGTCPTLLSECAKRDIPVSRLDIGEPPVTKWSALSFLWRKRKMKSELRNALQKHGSIDAVVMLSLSEKILVTEEAARLGVKVLWIEHDRVGPWLTRNPWLPALRKAAVHATTVCVSELSRRLYLDLGWPVKGTIAIPNGIDLARFPPRTQEPKNAVPRIGCIARLSPEKGVDVLIEAAAPLLGAILSIVGQGREEERLRALIRERGARDRIGIKPTEPNIPAFYRNLDLFVLPSSDHDPFGLVAAEAMATGVATIITDACGIADELKNGDNAVIVKAGDPEALRTAINDLAKDTAKRTRIADAGKRIAMQKFGLETMVQGYLDLLV
jgi:glycosyltransferase involved in cell wall biosynthesis